MNKSNFIQNKEVIPDTHNFIYQNNKYPFKFDYFKYASNFFSRNRTELEKTKDIYLIESDMNQNIILSSESINDFINFVQSKKIEINKENIFDLKYLSIKYEVTKLEEKVQEYITEHQEELVLEQLIYEQDKSENYTKIYEEIISTNLNYYIKESRLLDIKIPILYRILYNYRNQQKNKIIDEQPNKLLNEFIIKYLNKHGRSASVLFENIYFGETIHEILEILIQKYSEQFDFEYLKTDLVELIKNQMIEIKNLTKQNQTLKEANEKLHQEQETKEHKYSTAFENQQKTMNKMKLEYEQSLSKKTTEIIQLKEQNEQIIQEKEEERKKYEIKQKEHLQMIDNQQRKMSQLKEEYEKELSTKTKEILKQQEQNKQTIRKNKEIQIQYDMNPNNQMKGILTSLGQGNAFNAKTAGIINITASSIFNDNNIHNPENILLNDNSKYFVSKDEPNQWLCIDFKGHKVKPTHYSIKTSSEGGYYPQNWNIEGSMDNIKWTILDSQINNQSFKSRNETKTFYIQHNYEDEEYYRYTRIISTGYNSNNKNELDFSSIEFFGIVLQP